MNTDPIADFLSRIRNASRVNKSFVKVKSSKIVKKIADILVSEGYINGVEVDDSSKFKDLILTLKYCDDGSSVITDIQRASKPGLRLYSSAGKMPQVRGGLGTAVVSTSKGIFSCKEAKHQNVGGEILCYIW